MKKYTVLAACLSLFYLGAQEPSYQNTAYLPYYRLPKQTGLSPYQLEQGKDSGKAFDFVRYDPEPLLSYIERYGEPDIQQFQEYLISALGSGRITQINYFRLLPSKAGDGSIDFSGFYPQHMEYLLKLREIYGFRLTVCVAGGSSRFLPMMKSQKLREKFAQNIVATAQIWDLDGVDFDWEYPRNKKDMAAYIDLIQEVQKGMTAAKTGKTDYRVSVAISREQPALSTELFQAVDSVNFMAYDFAPRHSTMEDIEEMVAYLSARYAIAPRKIFLGMPFYGKEIKTKQRQSKSYQHLLQDFDLRPEDNEVGNYYFNGQNMIRQKFQFALEEGLGGIMIWEIGQDSKDHRSLLKVLPRQK